MSNPILHNIYFWGEMWFVDYSVLHRLVPVSDEFCRCLIEFLWTTVALRFWPQAIY